MTKANIRPADAERKPRGRTNAPGPLSYLVVQGAAAIAPDVAEAVANAVDVIAKLVK